MGKTQGDRSLGQGVRRKCSAAADVGRGAFKLPVPIYNVCKIEENSALCWSVKYANQLSRDERLGSTVRGSLCFSLHLRRISSARPCMRV